MKLLFFHVKEFQKGDVQRRLRLHVTLQPQRWRQENKTLQNDQIKTEKKTTNVQTK